MPLTERPFFTGRKCWCETSGLAVIVAIVVAVYAYLGNYPGDPYRFAKSDSNYYALLVNGFMDGRTGFQIDPSPQLVALKDPYDPAQRAEAGVMVMHDATYYKGRYYLYFGVAPAVTLFLPFRLITGWYFPQNLATVVFCTGGFLCSLALFLSVRRRVFADCPTWVVWLGAVMLGFGNFCAAMLSRNSVWEVPIASAYFFSCLGFWMLFLGWSGRVRSWRWLWLASVAFGLAVASRPHFVFCPGVLGGWWLWDWFRRVRQGEAFRFTSFTREAVGLFSPLIIIVGALLTYNYVRFDNAFEFGQKYQLSGNSQLNAKLVAGKFFPINFYLNFLAPAQFERYFPFFQVIRGYPGVRPEGYGGAEDPYGVLPNMPFSWLALAAPVLWIAFFRQRREVGRWLLIFGLAFLSIALPTMCFAWAANRYMVDFIPALLLVSAMGLLMAGSLDLVTRGLRTTVRASLYGLVAYTVAFNLGVAIQHNGLFRAYRPSHFEAMARWFNRPALWWEKWRGQDYGPAELTLRLPRDRPGKAEPLMVTGVSYRSDYLYVYYFPDGQRIQLGYTRTNHSHILSQPIWIDYNVPHRVGIQTGSLYPAISHPFFAGWSPEALRKAKETLRVTIDDIPYLLGEQEFFDSSPGFITFGQNNVSDYIEHEFSGKMLDVRRQIPALKVESFEGNAFLRLAVTLPVGAVGHSEPIVATGKPGEGDLLFFRQEDSTHIRLGLIHSGNKPLLSSPLEIKPGNIQIIDVSLGSFYTQPSNARERELAKMLIVRFNGLSVWNQLHPFYPAGSEPPAIGHNRGIDAEVRATLSGQIVFQQRFTLFPTVPDSPFAVGGYWLEANRQPSYGAMRLNIELPRKASPAFEPLLVFGSMASQLDYVLLNTPAPGKIASGYLHVGAALFQGQRVNVDVAQPQLIEIDVPSLYPPANDQFFAEYSLEEITAIKKGRARIAVNGETIFQARVPFFETTAAQVTIGEDKISKVFAPKFTGRILSTERFCLAAPPRLADNRGPLQIDLTFPSGGTGREALFATGEKGRLDTLFIVYENPQQAHLLCLTSEGARSVGKTFPLKAGSRRRLIIAWGGLYPESARPKEVLVQDWLSLQARLQVSLDGVEILSDTANFLQAFPQMVHIGQAAADAKSFSGLLHYVQRVP